MIVFHYFMAFFIYSQKVKKLKVHFLMNVKINANWIFSRGFRWKTDANLRSRRYLNLLDLHSRGTTEPRSKKNLGVRPRRSSMSFEIIVRFIQLIVYSVSFVKSYDMVCLCRSLRYEPSASTLNNKHQKNATDRKHMLLH